MYLAGYCSANSIQKCREQRHFNFRVQPFVRVVGGGSPGILYGFLSSIPGEFSLFLRLWASFMEARRCRRHQCPRCALQVIYFFDVASIHTHTIHFSIYVLQPGIIVYFIYGPARIPFALTSARSLMQFLTLQPKIK
jgi:hypothetical protein